MSNPFEILAFVAIAVVFVILCLGLYTLFKGGDGAPSRSNQLMRMRVLVQFIAVMLLVAGFYWKSHT